MLSAPRPSSLIQSVASSGFHCFLQCLLVARPSDGASQRHPPLVLLSAPLWTSTKQSPRQTPNRRSLRPTVEGGWLWPSHPVENNSGSWLRWCSLTCRPSGWRPSCWPGLVVKLQATCSTRLFANHADCVSRLNPLSKGDLCLKKQGATDDVIAVSAAVKDEAVLGLQQVSHAALQRPVCDGAF